MPGLFDQLGEFFEVILAVGIESSCHDRPPSMCRQYKESVRTRRQQRLLCVPADADIQCPALTTSQVQEQPAVHAERRVTVRRRLLYPGKTQGDGPDVVPGDHRVSPPVRVASDSTA